MASPWECLEHVATDVASLVPDEASLVRVEMECFPEPFDVRFVSYIYQPGCLYDASKSTALSVPAGQANRIRSWLEKYLDHSRSWDDELERMTLSVAIDGTFSMGQTCRRRGSQA